MTGSFVRRQACGSGRRLAALHCRYEWKPYNQDQQTTSDGLAGLEVVQGEEGCTGRGRLCRARKVGAGRGGAAPDAGRKADLCRPSVAPGLD